MSMAIKHNKFEPIYKFFRNFCHSVSCSGSQWKKYSSEREIFSCHRKYPKLAGAELGQAQLKLGLDGEGVNLIIRTD